MHTYIHTYSLSSVARNGDRQSRYLFYARNTFLDGPRSYQAGFPPLFVFTIFFYSLSYARNTFLYGPRSYQAGFYPPFFFPPLFFCSIYFFFPSPMRGTEHLFGRPPKLSSRLCFSCFSPLFFFFCFFSLFYERNTILAFWLL